MAAGLQPGEPGPRQIRRILVSQVDDAVAALTGKRATDRDVHDARKTIKKARATLRLLRDAIPGSAYESENIALRDAARPLSAVRDARILIDSLDRLEKRYGAPAKHAIPEAFRHHLNEQQRRTRRQVSGLGSGARSPRAALVRSRRRIAHWRLDEGDWPELGRALKRIYGQGRKAFAVARSERSVEALHEWRKQVKYLWHQLQILEPLWPGPIGELADQAHKLADYLGDDHDLAVLRQKVLEQPAMFPGRGGAGPLLALIDRFRLQLQDKAIVLGTRLYEEKPARFAAHFGRYWRSWRSVRSKNETRSASA